MRNRTIGYRAGFQGLWLLLSAVGVMSGQTPAPRASAAKSTVPVIIAYKVAHDHRIGSGHGELRITETGIEYEGEGKDEARHSRAWRDDDIKRLEISKTELRVIAYEADQIALIPRQVPFSKGGKSVRVGNEHEYEFRLLGGEITEDLARVLLARFKRPIASTVIPIKGEESDALIFEIPVYHRYRAGGEPGVLRIYERHLVFVADKEDHSRYWRYSDVRDIGRLGRFEFEVATYEGQFGSDGKSYIFDLKQPMTETEYDSLWKLVYGRGQELRPRPIPDKHKDQ